MVTIRRSYLLLVLLISALLASCAINLPPSSYSLEVVNRCLGSNATVDVYIDGVYQGQVFFTQTFRGIAPGSHALFARGTGRRPSTFSDTVPFTSDIVWTLCPGSGLEAPSGNALSSVAPADAREDGAP